MSTRSGPDSIIREAAVYAAVDTWYECTDTVVMSNNADMMRIIVKNTVADAGRVAIKLQVRDSAGAFCDMIGHGAGWYTGSLSTGDCVALPLFGARLCPRDTIKVWFQAASNAASAKIEIGALAYDADGSVNSPMPGIDSVTGALGSIDYAHHEMHSGSHYFVKTWRDINGSGTVEYFGFQTPITSKRAHFKFNMSSEAEFILNIHRDCTYTALGTPITSINCDQDSSNTSELLAYGGPTPNVLGDKIWDGRLGAGKSSTGFTLGVDYEIIAATNEFYIFEIEKVATSEHYVDIDFWWYEHSPRPPLT